MFENLFKKAESKVSISQVMDLLEGYNNKVVKGSIYVKEKYNIKGQEMGRLIIEPNTQETVKVVDGWGSLITTINLNELRPFLREIFTGVHVWSVTH